MDQGWAVQTSFLTTESQLHGLQGSTEKIIWKYRLFIGFYRGSFYKKKKAQTFEFRLTGKRELNECNKILKFSGEPNLKAKIIDLKKINSRNLQKKNSLQGPIILKKDNFEGQNFQVKYVGHFGEKIVEPRKFKEKNSGSKNSHEKIPKARNSSKKIPKARYSRGQKNEHKFPGGENSHKKFL